jgi:hypothetical protein
MLFTARKFICEISGDTTEPGVGWILASLARSALSPKYRQTDWGPLRDRIWLRSLQGAIFDAISSLRLGEGS